MKKLFLALALIISALGASAPSRAAEPIKIGALFNLTGGMSSIDGPGLKGAKLKAKLINDAGGLLGKRKIEIIAIDTKTDLKATASGAKEALAAGVVAGLGYGDTDYVRTAAPFFQEAGIPFITSGATHPDLPKWIGPYLFMVSFGDNDQAAAMAAFTINQLKAKNIALLTDRTQEFTKALADYYSQRLKALGGRIVIEETFAGGDRDFAGQITRIKNAIPQPQAIFASAVPDEAGQIVRQVRQAGLTVPILSGDGFDTERIVSVPGPILADEVYFTTHAYRDDPRLEVSDFIKAYKQEYGHPPENAFTALGFDAVGLLAAAIDRARTTDGKALRLALAATNGYQAVTGRISYNRISGVPAKPVAIIGLHKGKYKLEETWTPER